MSLRQTRAVLSVFIHTWQRGKRGKQIVEAIQQVDVKFMVVVQAKGQGGDHNGKSRKRNHHAENQVREPFDICSSGLLLEGMDVWRV